MSFTRAQQPEFRQLVEAAWLRHCGAERMEAGHPSRRSWYEGELEAATGHASTKACNAGRDYEQAMAHFEALAGAGLKWNLRLYSGDARRMLHELGEVTEEHGIDEDYLRGVARRMLAVDDPPALHTLPREMLVRILGEVKRYVRRRLKRESVEPF